MSNANSRVLNQYAPTATIVSAKPLPSGIIAFNPYGPVVIQAPVGALL